MSGARCQSRLDPRPSGRAALFAAAAASIGGADACGGVNHYGYSYYDDGGDADTSYYYPGGRGGAPTGRGGAGGAQGARTGGTGGLAATPSDASADGNAAPDVEIDGSAMSDASAEADVSTVPSMSSDGSTDE